MKKISFMVIVTVLFVHMGYAVQQDSIDCSINYNEIHDTIELTSFQEIEFLDLADSVAMIPVKQEKQSFVSEWSQKMAIRLFFLVEDQCSFLYRKFKPLLKVLIRWRKKIF